MKHEITEEFLKRQYEELGKTFAEIASETGCSKDGVRCLAKRYGIPARATGRKKANIKGRRFGSLLVIKETAGSDLRHPAWQCICDCGISCSVYATELLNGKKSCTKCSRARTGGILWTGCGEISGCYWSTVRYGAEVRKLKFDISIEDAWEKFVAQDRMCAITGITLTMTRNGRHQTASLDRIDSHKGYTKKNIQWIHKRINAMKSNMDESELLHWCVKVVDYSAKKKEPSKK